VAAFHEQHHGLYGHADRTAPVEFVNLRVVHTHALPTPTLAWAPGGADDADPSDARPVYFAEIGDYVETPIYDRHQLHPEQAIEGPAIVEQADTTVVLYPGHRASVHAGGSIVVECTKP